MTMPDTLPRLSIPESLLTVESVEAAVTIYSASGLKPILTHAPLGQGCTCGKTHDRSSTGGSSIGKHPILSNWQKKEFTIDELRDQIARLKFTPNVGMVLGKQPSTGEYLIAVDVDDAERFAKLETELGALPDTPRCDSGRGHRLFFVSPPEIDTARLVNVTGLGGEAGVDVKVEGGQVVVAPSLHANGKQYVWTRAGAVAALPMQWAMILLREPEIPQWVEKYTPKTLNENKRIRGRAERWLEVAVTNEARALAACGTGARNNTLFRTACMLFEKCAGVYLGHKWQWIHDELLSASRACGLPEHEARATLASADKRVRESGKVRQPVWLADPASTPPPETPGAEFDAPAPSDDPWMLAPSSQRPVIKVSTQLYADVNAAVVALRAEENLYQREGRLVHVTRVSREEVESESDAKRQVEGSPQIRLASRALIKGKLSKVAVFQKWVESAGRYKPILPTEDIVGHVHDAGEWTGIRSLIGLVETPFFRPGGDVMQEPGYDPSTRYLYMPTESFPKVVDDAATQSNARWAFGFLKEVFEDFPYVSVAHLSVPIAAVLTLVARPAILGAIPACLFDASTRGSGKTLQTDAIATIITGRSAPRMNYTADDEEMQKVLAGYALKGSSFVCLDNVPVGRPFGGGSLDRVLTARDDVDLRVLGGNNIPTLPWRALVMATGNNMSLYGDTSRRVLMARLEPTEESPEHRTKFRHDDLLGWVKVQRPRLVSAALLILRAYFRAGRPDMGCARWGSFEEWSRLIPHAIVFAGGADPMLARPEKDEEVDNELRNIRCFMTGIRGMLGDDDFRLSSVVELLYKSERVRDENGHTHDGLEDLRDAIETIVGRKGLKYDGKVSAPDPVELGRRLSDFRGRIIGGLRLVSKAGGGGVKRWRIESVSRS